MPQNAVTLLYLLPFHSCSETTGLLNRFSNCLPLSMMSSQVCNCFSANHRSFRLSLSDFGPSANYNRARKRIRSFEPKTRDATCGILIFTNPGFHCSAACLTGWVSSSDCVKATLYVTQSQLLKKCHLQARKRNQSVHIFGFLAHATVDRHLAPGETQRWTITK